MAKVLKKDVLFFLRSDNALLLLVLVPLLTVVILGNVFNQKTASGVRILVCSGDELLGRAYSAGLSAGPFLVDLSADPGCVADGRAAISTGKLSAVVSIPSNASARIASGGGELVDVYYDNSQDDTASFILAYVSGITEGVSSNISSSFISSAWSGLRSMAEQVEVAGSELTQVRARILQVADRMDAAGAQLQNISIAGIYGKVGEMENFLIEQKNSVSLANSSLGSLGERLDSANRTLNDSRSLLADADAFLRDDISTTETILNASRGVEQSLLAGYSVLCSVSSCPNESLSFVSNLTGVLEERRDREVEMRGKISAIDANLTAMQGELENATFRLGDGRAYLADVYGQLSGAEGALTEMRSMLSDFSRIQESSLSDLDYSKKVFGNVSSEIGQSLPRLESARASLVALYSRDPASVVRPVSLKPQAAFLLKGFSYLFPALVAMILMFTLMLLGANGMISERKGGTLLRSYLSRPSAALIVASKELSLLLVGVFEAGLMFLAGSVLFSLSVSAPLDFILGVLAVSVVFSSFGILIGLLARDESSALLAVVGLSIPSIFLSGGLLSFEFLPAGMKAVSEALPLSSSSLALRASAVYGAAPALSPLLAYAAVAGALCLLLLPRRLE